MPAPQRSLANLAKHNLSQLTALVKTRLKLMQNRPAFLEGFVVSTALDVSPFCNAAIENRLASRASLAEPAQGSGRGGVKYDNREQ